MYEDSKGKGWEIYNSNHICNSVHGVAYLLTRSMTHTKTGQNDDVEQAPFAPLLMFTSSMITPRMPSKRASQQNQTRPGQETHESEENPISSGEKGFTKRSRAHAQILKTSLAKSDDVVIGCFGCFRCLVIITSHEKCHVVVCFDIVRELLKSSFFSQIQAHVIQTMSIADGVLCT